MYPGDVVPVMFAFDNLRNAAPEMVSIIRELVGICEGVADELSGAKVGFQSDAFFSGATHNVLEALALLSPVLKKEG
jgi:hypothetical protein